MSEFFENEEFVTRLERLPYGETKILKIMKEIKEKNPGMDIIIFICILDKRNSPSSSNIKFSSNIYRYSVELWNKYIFDNYKCDFDLLISYKNICF
jgi:hypothetical protein